MRILFEPSTLLLVAGGFKAFSSITQGIRQANFLEQQAEQEELAAAREQRDLAKERARKLSSTRAALAAGGADLSSGSALQISKDQSAEFAPRSARLKQDSATARRSLRTRASGARVQGFLDAGGQVLGSSAQAGAFSREGDT